jgi:carnitine 3-dehydrogenase
VAEEAAVLPSAVGLLGGGVIGGGWAARFLIHGVDVRLFDPYPEAGRKVADMVTNARRAWSKLTLLPLPPEGKLTLVPSPEEASTDVELVQESVPEREDLKRQILAAADRVAPEHVVVASSTSGLLPSSLQEGLRHPERLVVGHPFNPVYLLPLVEVCGGERTSPEALTRCAAYYRSVGMAPLTVRHEIEGFIADRLMEALWREALWLVHDDVTTVEEVDDAILLGAGLRWSFMGTFLTYRIAGGEAGMHHFMQQFGPALEWPWSKLTDVPPLTDGLIDKIVEQSDAQAKGRSARELERLRDDCLVSVIQALRSRGVGAGAVLEAHERRLFDLGGPGVMHDVDEVAGPLRLHSLRVPPNWLDYNGHVHESRYLQMFGDASDALFRYVGVDRDYLATQGTYYTVETHLSFLREVHADDDLLLETRVLGFDDRRLHVMHSLLRSGDDDPLAEAEQMFVHVGANDRKSIPAAPNVLARIAVIARTHGGLPRPERAGRMIGLRDASRHQPAAG